MPDVLTFAIYDKNRNSTDELQFVLNIDDPGQAYPDVNGMQASDFVEFKIRKRVGFDFIGLDRIKHFATLFKQINSIYLQSELKWKL